MSRPKPLYRDGFRYDGVFTSSAGVAFEPPEALRDICRRAPSRPAAERRRGSTASISTTSDAPQNLLTREFVIAQHKFYGVPIFWKRRDNFAKLFRDLVLEGRVSPLVKKCVGYVVMMPRHQLIDHLPHSHLSIITDARPSSRKCLEMFRN